MAVLDLERLIGSKVAAAVSELNGDLEALIADAIDRELDRLVAQAVAERANGHHSPCKATEGVGPTADLSSDRRARRDDSGPNQSAWRSDSQTKTCKTCGQTKPVADFDRDRRVCRECRRDIARRRYAERQAAPVPFDSTGSNGNGSPAAITPAASALSFDRK